MHVAREKKTDLAIAIAKSGRFRMRAICRALKVARSNMSKRITMVNKHEKRTYFKSTDQDLLKDIREFIEQRPTYGYRRITALLNRKLKENLREMVNHKRVYRVMKMDGLLLQRHTGRPHRAHTGQVVTLKSNMRWCSDVLTIQCWNGDQVSEVSSHFSENFF